MAEPLTVARPYAKAAFRKAAVDKAGKNALEHWSNMLRLAAGVLQVKELRDWLLSSIPTPEQKVAAFKKVMNNYLEQDQENFLFQLAQKSRLAVLVEISLLFEQFKSEQERVCSISINTAFELSEQQVQDLSQLLENNLRKSVRIDVQVDKSLLGGILIKMGDTVIDHTVKGRLRCLAETICE